MNEQHWTATARAVANDLRPYLAGEYAWTQGAFARDLYGEECDPTSPAARCWCLVGAIQAAVAHGRPGYTLEDAYRAVYRSIRRHDPNWVVPSHLAAIQRWDDLAYREAMLVWNDDLRMDDGEDDFGSVESLLDSMRE